MTATTRPHFDEPAELARLVLACPRPVLLGLDVDGVLAPIVDHAGDARLLEGIGDAIAAVAALDRFSVAVVSGRSLDDLDRFGFGPDIDVIGSHGMETRRQAMRPLDGDELAVLERLDQLALQAADAAGRGAWVERKPASVVVHVRQADPHRGAAALDELSAATTGVGATAKHGSNVLELFARPADKGSALVELRDRVGAATTVFVGDDITDEDAFARLASSDVAIKVGEAPTVATRRLADPVAVLTWLRHLTH